MAALKGMVSDFGAPQFLVAAMLLPAFLLMLFGVMMTETVTWTPLATIVPVIVGMRRHPLLLARADHPDIQAEHGQSRQSRREGDGAGSAEDPHGRREHHQRSAGGDADLAQRDLLWLAGGDS